MIGQNVARRYAKALIEVGVESGNLEALVNELTAIAQVVETSSELAGVLENPEVPRSARKAVLMEIAAKLSLSTLARNTVALLNDNGRLRVLPLIAATLREEADRRAGLVRAKVTSAQPLTDAYVAKLQAALEKRFSKKVVIERSVDPKLLAGVVTRVGDVIIDGSLRAQLEELRHSLAPN